MKYRHRMLGLLLCSLFFLYGCANESRHASRTMYLGFQQMDSSEKPDPVQLKSPLIVKPHVIAWTVDFSQPFPLAQCEEYKTLGIIPMLRWEPWIWQGGRPIPVADILSGQWDTYLQSWVDAAKAIDTPVLIAFAPDFNANRYPWSVQNLAQNPEQYKSLYRYVVSFFKKQGARNVIWVWSYLAKNTPEKEWNKPVLAYPGDDVVDWIGIASVNEVDSLQTMFGAAVTVASEQYAEKPIMITRFFYDGTHSGDQKMVEALTGPLSRVNAILLSNPKMLPKTDNFLYTSLFTADIESFGVLHLGI